MALNNQAIFTFLHIPRISQGGSRKWDREPALNQGVFFILSAVSYFAMFATSVYNSTSRIR